MAPCSAVPLPRGRLIRLIEAARIACDFGRPALPSASAGEKMGARGMAKEAGRETR